MSTCGLDTSVVLRLLVGVPEDQAQRALDAVQQCSQRQIKVCVSDLVIQETYHALLHHYHVPIQEAVECLLDFLSSGVITGTGHAMSVLQEFSGSGPGVADRLIRKGYLDQASTVLTFDARFARLPNMKKL